VEGNLSKVVDGHFREALGGNLREGLQDNPSPQGTVIMGMHET
jgi:hypothetical protein